MKAFIALIAVIGLFGCGSDLAGVGETCELPEDCDTGLCLKELGTLSFPGGLCTNACQIGPQGESLGCDELTEVCLLHLATLTQYCYPTCETGDDCRKPYKCVTVDDIKACLPL